MGTAIFLDNIILHTMSIIITFHHSTSHRCHRSLHSSSCHLIFRGPVVHLSTSIATSLCRIRFVTCASFANMVAYLLVEVFQAKAGVPFGVAVTHHLFCISLVCHRYGFQGLKAGLGGKLEAIPMFRRRS